MTRAITSIGALVPVLERSWPPAQTYSNGPFVVKDPDGGGNRVSAARLASTSDESVSASDLDAAEAQMEKQGRKPLFMVLDNQTTLNAALDTRDYVTRDHTIAMVIRAADLAATPPPVTAFSIWPPLAIQTEIWEVGGIDAARRAVMERAVHCTKTSLFGRILDKPAGAAYIGLLHDASMLHALEVAPIARRQGLAAHMMRLAAQWTVENGAEWLSILVTQQNVAAQGLYTSLGMKPVGSYVYREKEGGTAQ